MNNSLITILDAAEIIKEINQDRIYFIQLLKADKISACFSSDLESPESNLIAVPQSFWRTRGTDQLKPKRKFGTSPKLLFSISRLLPHLFEKLEQAEVAIQNQNLVVLEASRVFQFQSREIDLSLMSASDWEMAAKHVKSTRSFLVKNAYKSVEFSVLSREIDALVDQYRENLGSNAGRKPKLGTDEFWEVVFEILSTSNQNTKQESFVADIYQLLSIKKLRAEQYTMTYVQNRVRDVWDKIKLILKNKNDN